MKSSKNIDSYIKSASKEAQPQLQKLRVVIRNAAPQAKEAISYNIPTYKLNGNLVHFAVFKDHVSFFPTSSGISAFKKELSKYKNAKGTIQFPLHKPLPLGLIQRIVKFRVKETLAAASRKGLKMCSRGHFYKGSGPCPICWPGRLAKGGKKT